MRDEGYVMEHGTWHVVKQLFKANGYHSPKVGEPPKQCELIDILDFYDVGMCLFEMKAVGVLSSSPDRSTERRAANFEKQINNGLKQIAGAMKAFVRGDRLSARDGRDITLPATTGPLCFGIVMVSEMMPAID
jgi:hypothetical protein